MPELDPEEIRERAQKIAQERGDPLAVKLIGMRRLPQDASPAALRRARNAVAQAMVELREEARER